MKIAIYHDLPSGGAKRALCDTVCRLASSHMLDVFTLSTANHTFCDLRPFVNQHKVYDFQPLAHFTSPFGRLNQLQRWRDLKRLDTIMKQVARDIDAHGYDVLYVYPSMWTQAPSVLKHLQTPTLYHVQEPLRSVSEPVIPRPYINKGWRRHVDRIDPLLRLYQRKLRLTDRVNTQQASFLVANSKFTAVNVREIYGKHAEVAYLGVDIETFVPQSSRQLSQSVLSVGAIRPAKGFDFLIESLALIPKANRPPLLLVGNDADQNETAFLRQLAHRCEVNLSIETMVNQETLVRLYNQVQLVVYAPIREPFGLVPLEAMACGTPVIGVAEGGVCETVMDGINGRLVPRDPVQFSAAVHALLEDRSQRDRLGQQAREYVLAHWTWDQAVQRIEHFLHQVAKCDSSQSSTRTSVTA